MADIDEPNFDIFASFPLDIFKEDIPTATDSLTEITETTETTRTATSSEKTVQNEQTENVQLNDVDIDSFIEQNRNRNTTKKTTSDLNVFYRWAKTVNETRRLEEILPEELDKLLAHFFLKARKQNGDDFEPDTLTSLCRSFDRFLRENGKQ